MLGKHTLTGWSKTRALVSLSSGESELYAALKASAEALGLIALLTDLGYTVKEEIWGDASAALGIIHRRGLGKTRHIDTGLFWIQQTVAENRLKYFKVLGKDNPADLYTKSLDVATSDTHVGRLEYTFIKGRSTEAPELYLISKPLDDHNYGETQAHCEWLKVTMAKLSVSKSSRKKKSEPTRMINCVSYDNIQQIDAMR